MQVEKSILLIILYYLTFEAYVIAYITSILSAYYTYLNTLLFLLMYNNKSIK